MVDELIPVFLESPNDTLKGGSDIGEIGNTTTYNEDFAIRARVSTSQKIDYKKSLAEMERSKDKGTY